MAHLSRTRVQLAPGPSFADQALPGRVEYVQADIFVSSVRRGMKPHLASVRTQFPTEQAPAYLISVVFDTADAALKAALENWLPRIGLRPAQQMDRDRAAAERRHRALVDAIKGMPSIP